MKNNSFYSITEAQLIIVLIFGFIGGIFCIAVGSEEGDSFLGLIGIGLIFFVFFYIFGWKANKKSNK